jgi:TolB-like protein
MSNTARNRFLWGICLSGVCVFLGCATPAVVFVSPDYNPQQLKRVAIMDFDDFPGQSGTGPLVSDIFGKYLISSPFQLIERSEVDKILQAQNISASEASNPAQTEAVGKVLGVNAVVLGSLSEFSNTSEQTVMVDIPQEQTDPVLGEIYTRHGPVMGVTGYTTTVTDQSVPETETLPARVGISARMVDVKTGAVLWSGSSSADGMNLSSAAEDASSSLVQALQKAIAKQKLPS